MPLVRRKIKQVNDSTTYSTHVVDHVLYVPPAEKRMTDVEVEPTREQLGELAQLYPEEYGEKAKEAGVLLGVHGRLGQLLNLPAKKLAQTIAGMDENLEAATLWAILEKEHDREGGPRSTVLAALAEKSVTIEDAGDGDDEDDTLE